MKLVLFSSKKNIFFWKMYTLNTELSALFCYFSAFAKKTQRIIDCQPTGLSWYLAVWLLMRQQNCQTVITSLTMQWPTDCASVSTFSRSSTCCHVKSVAGVNKAINAATKALMIIKKTILYSSWYSVWTRCDVIATFTMVAMSHRQNSNSLINWMLVNFT